jgi:serine/threonine protein kinase
VTLYNVIRWLHKAIEAVRLLQSIRIIHYDIKGPNMTIDADNNLYLIDFGLSWQLHHHELVNLSELMNTFYPVWPLFHNIISDDHAAIEEEYKHSDYTIPKSTGI